MTPFMTYIYAVCVYRGLHLIPQGLYDGFLAYLANLILIRFIQLSYSYPINIFLKICLLAFLSFDDTISWCKFLKLSKYHTILLKNEYQQFNTWIPLNVSLDYKFNDVYSTLSVWVKIYLSIALYYEHMITWASQTLADTWSCCCVRVISPYLFSFSHQCVEHFTELVIFKIRDHFIMFGSV